MRNPLARPLADFLTDMANAKMYFMLHPHGQELSGHWVGLSYDGKIVTGWGAMAHSEQEARSIIGRIKAEEVR